MNKYNAEKIDLLDSTLSIEKILQWANQFSNVLYIHSNNYPLEREDQTKGYIQLLGISKKAKYLTFKDLKIAKKTQSKWAFGYISYDYKNLIEKLPKPQKSTINFPKICFFEPDFTFFQTPKGWFYEGNIAWKNLVVEIKNYVFKKTVNTRPFSIKNAITKDHYIKQVQALQKHIHAGDIYEINFCQPFYADQVDIDPLSTFHNLNKHSPNPHACFLKINQKYLVCASPERFLKKEGNTLYTQPIKGTSARFADRTMDEASKRHLMESEKERAENIMIVDLVRNDLSKIAQKNSVRVDELCQIYSFPQVHQMISTVSCELKKTVSFKDIIHATFPMGSMTGAPKIRAMELIDQYELGSRNIFSGTVGYIDPEGNFDFNVVIRSILYNQTKKHLSFWVGSAVTALSDAEQEYKECLLKASAIRSVLEK